MYYNPYTPTTPMYGQPFNGAAPDNLSMLRQQNQFQSQNQFNQYQPQIQSQQPPAQSNGIIWVQGEEGAKAYLIAPNNTVILWDSENPVIYIKSADASGVPSMRVLDWAERTGTAKTPLDSVQNQASDYVTRDEWEALTARVDELTSKSTQGTKKTIKGSEE